MRKIKMMITAVLLLLLTAVTMAQGIRFEENLSWKQVLAKAKKENKYIFVDAMATWCVPCKEMETKVYPDSILGLFANERFVSVKVQMDRTPNDSKAVRAWYADAKVMMEKYEISVFPTYLFFSPEGKVSHQGVGLMETSSFLSLMKDAMDPVKQTYGRYYTLLEDYNMGRKNYLEMPFMVEMSKKFKKKELEQKLALDYIHNYLLKLGENELYTEKNIAFISNYVSSKDKAVFGIFYPDGSRADSVVKGISAFVLSKIITKEEIESKILRDNDYRQPKVDIPDWAAISATINAKYRVTANVEISSAKRKWYREARKDGDKLALATLEYIQSKYKIAEMENYQREALRINSINNSLYTDVAMVTDNSDILLSAAKIQFEAMNKYAELRAKEKKSVSNWGLIDTYACLLYKARETKAAINWMEAALLEVPGEAGLKNRLALMNSGKKLMF